MSCNRCDSCCPSCCECQSAGFYTGQTERATLADTLEAKLKKLDAEAEHGIDDPVWLFERTAELVKAAIKALR
jgi:hypothetical protein